MQQVLSENENYIPAEDTFFIEDHLHNICGEYALEIGTGSGYLAEILSKNFTIVIGTDINFSQLRDCEFSLKNRICCDGAEPIRGEFDLVVCNLPYLPSKKISDRTIDGGSEGVEIPLHIIKSAKRCLKKDGKFLFLTSSLANYRKLIKMAKNLGLKLEIVARKKLFFEELILIEVRK